MRGLIRFIMIVSVWINGIFLVYPHPCASEVLITVEQALKQIYPKASGTEKKVLELMADDIRLIEQKAPLVFEGAHLDQIVVYTIHEDGTTAGFAFEDTVKGKWGPIHYLVGLAPEGIILQAIILDYQEIRGKPIAQKRFLNQFKRKAWNDRLVLGKDIDGITGATISSRSLTDGIRKVLCVFHLLMTSGKPPTP